MFRPFNAPAVLIAVVREHMTCMGQRGVRDLNTISWYGIAASVLVLKMMIVVAIMNENSDDRCHA